MNISHSGSTHAERPGPKRCAGATALALALLVTVACSRNSDPETEHRAASTEAEEQAAPGDRLPPKLSASELADVLDSGDVFFLDVRSADEIRELGTLPGHVNIPIDELEQRLAEIPADASVVTA